VQTVRVARGFASDGLFIPSDLLFPPSPPRAHHLYVAYSLTTFPTAELTLETVSSPSRQTSRASLSPSLFVCLRSLWDSVEKEIEAGWAKLQRAVKRKAARAKERDKQGNNNATADTPSAAMLSSAVPGGATTNGVVTRAGRERVPAFEFIVTALEKRHRFSIRSRLYSTIRRRPAGTL
jgi:hypothetical protein